MEKIHNFLFAFKHDMCTTIFLLFSIDVCNNAAMTLMFCRFCCQQKPQIANIKDKKKRDTNNKIRESEEAALRK